MILHAHIFALNHNQQGLCIQVAWPGSLLCNIVYKGHQMPRPHCGSGSSWLGMTKWFMGTSFISFRSQQLLWGGSSPQSLAYLSLHKSGQVAAHRLVFIVWKSCLTHVCTLFPCWADRERHGSSDTLQPFCCPSVRVQGLVLMSHLGWGLHRLQTFRSWHEQLIPQCYCWQWSLLTNMNDFLTPCFNPCTLTLPFLMLPLIFLL